MLVFVFAQYLLFDFGCRSDYMVDRCCLLRQCGCRHLFVASLLVVVFLPARLRLADVYLSGDSLFGVLKFRSDDSVVVFVSHLLYFSVGKWFVVRYCFVVRLCGEVVVGCA